MNISQELLQHLLIGAGIATAIFWRLGWLRFPSQVGVSPSPASYPAPTTPAQFQDGVPPSYKSMSNIPFEVAITPQNQVK